MADYYVDPAATGNNDGTTPADAWTDPSAIAGVVAGSTAWVRRTVDFEITSGLTFNTSSSPGSPIRIIGWPRTSFTGRGLFEAGGPSVADIEASFSMSWMRAGARWIKLDSDGHWYFITNAQGTDYLRIDRPFAGSTSFGDFTVKADEDYTGRPQAGIDAGWDSDDQHMPRYYGNPSAVLFDFGTSTQNYILKNIYIGKNGSAAYNMLRVQAQSTQGLIGLVGCVLLVEYAANTDALVLNNSWLSLRGCIIQGSSTSLYDGIHTCGPLSFRDGAINFVKKAFYFHAAGAILDLENLNIGVENACDVDFDISSYPAIITGKDVWVSNCSSYYPTSSFNKVHSSYPMGNLQGMSIENWGKDLGQVKRFDGQLITSLRVDDSATDPLQRSNGNDCVIKVDLSINSTSWGPSIEVCSSSVFDQRIWQTAESTKSYRVYVQSLVALASEELTLEVSHIDSHAADNRYTEAHVIGTGAISARSGSSDWSQYIEVTNVTVPIDCAVRLRLRLRKAGSSGDYVYIDPKVVVS